MHQAGASYKKIKSPCTSSRLLGCQWVLNILESVIDFHPNDCASFRKDAAHRGYKQYNPFQDLEKCVSYSRMLSNQVYSSKFSLGMKRGQVASNFADTSCQKNVSQEIFLLAMQKKIGKVAGKKRGGTSLLG